MADQPAEPSKAEAEEPAATFVVEEKRRLSESLIWRLQRQYFEGQGEQAWSSGQVPFHITSNTFITKSYARALLGFLRDCASPTAPLGALDPGQPIYIVELAAGSGQFAYFFLRKLLPLLAALPALRALKLRYVMTDFTSSNLDAWKAQPLFQPFLEQGVLDYALFDIERDTSIRTVSGDLLEPGSVKNPICVLANYTFDSTVQDAFWVNDGELQEGLATLLAKTEKEDLTGADALSRVTLKYEQRRVRGEYYGDPDLDAILDYYRQRLGDTSFLMPLGALRAIRSLQALAGGRLFLLTGDKGFLDQDDMECREVPHRDLHGSFSMMVNFHALGLYFQQKGGLTLQTSSRTGLLKFCAFVSGAAPEAFPETALAFKEAVEQFSPSDYFGLLLALRDALPKPPLDVLLPLLRLSDWDLQIVLYFAGAMVEHAGSAQDPLRLDLRRALEQVAENTYHMGRDVSFELGRIYSGLSMPKLALDNYLESLRLFGEHHATLFNIGLCHYRLQQPQEALTWIERSLAKKPDFGSAREWRNRILGEKGKR